MAHDVQSGTRVEILGPVRVRTGSHATVVSSPAERALLCALALRAGDTVPTAVLCRSLWGEDPPASATKSLRSHLSRLRHHLGADLARPEPGGYRMVLNRADTDVGAMEDLLRAGRTALDAGDAATARIRFAEAESLWRGEPLGDLAAGPSTAQVERLRGLLWEAREGRIRAELDLTDTPETLVDELRALVVDDPMRESLWGLLMLALYRCGHQVEALQAYRRLSALLAEEWGMDPSPTLERLRWQILQQDPQLEPAPPPPPFHVPAAVTAFVGREGQVDTVRDALRSGRLVTLHGSGGVGKSRLALEVTQRERGHPEYPDGVWWVDLTVCTDGPGAVRRMAEALGVSASPFGSPEQALVGHLQRRALLLVLDNCEHVAGAIAPVLADLLEAAPAVALLATSRLPLGIPGEAVWDVPPLAVPPEGASDEEAERTEAVILFQQRRGHRVDSPRVNSSGEVAALCRRLDGLPLALELAAAQARSRTVAEISARLAAEGLSGSTMVAGAPHHLSLARAIDWSYAVLMPVERRLLERLSVFPGEFDAAAAVAVGESIPGVSAAQADRSLAALVDASMVQARPAGSRTRYRLLFVMREFAAARLAERGEGEGEDARRAFTAHYRRLAAQAVGPLDGDRPAPWLRAIERELVNLRTAAAWSSQHEEPTSALELVRVLGRVVWGVSGDLSADLALLRGAVERAETAGVEGEAPEEDEAAVDARADAVAWAWQELVTAAYLSGEIEPALRACTRAEAQFTRTGNDAGLADVLWHRGAAEMLALGDLAASERSLREGARIARRAGVATPEAWCLAHLGQLQTLQGTVTDETSRVLARAASIGDPEDVQLQTHLAMDHALVHLTCGEWDESIEDALRGELLGRGAGLTAMMQATMVARGTALLGTGDADAARPVLLHAAQIALDAGNRVQFGLAMQALARVVEHDGDPRRAARVWGQGTACAPPWPGLARLYLPRASRASLGEVFDAQVSVGAALQPAEAMELALG